VFETAADGFDEAVGGTRAVDLDQDVLGSSFQYPSISHDRGERLKRRR